jgi:hypothetical protein
MCASLDKFCVAVVESEFKTARPGQRRWTEVEDELLRRLHGHVTDAEIGEILGRSETGVMIHWKRDLHLPAPTTDPAYITARRIADALGADNHKSPMWIDRGIMPGEYLPRRDNQLHRRVLWTDFIGWLQDPQNWVWFDIDKVKDEGFREIIKQAKEKWEDEWWTTPKVAEYHHVTPKDVLRYIMLGKIKARHVVNIGGRNRGRWAYWFVLRSEATREDLVFKHNKKWMEMQNG